MEKERRIKTISAIALIVAVLGLTVAFAVLSVNLVINGSAKVEAGKWDIYFANLSSAKTKGGAQVTGNAVINPDNKTMIKDINVTLTKPMDEVTYTVDLINEGTIDAEISDITEPEMDDNAKEYVAFSATYADKKEITKGDVLKAGKTEKVTISIKFKEEVTKLPDADIDITLSYEINYVQTDQKVENNVHNGRLPEINYDNLKQGDEVTLATEKFYVMKNESDKVTLLAKYNLLVGNTVTFEGDVDPEDGPSGDFKVTPIEGSANNYGKQDASAKGMDFVSSSVTGAIEFAKNREGYWNGNHYDYPCYVYDINSSIYEPIENYKKYLQEMDYNIEEARLMSHEEAEELGCNFEEDNCNSAPNWVYSTSYWLGSASSSGEVLGIISYSSRIGYVSNMLNIYLGARPVIVISK